MILTSPRDGSALCPLSWTTRPDIDILKPESGGVSGCCALARVRCVFHSDLGSPMYDVPPSETSRWRAVVRVLRSPMDAAGCILLPASCALCGSSLPRLSYVPICDACWTEIPVQEGDSCARCGDSLDRPAGNVGSSLCRVCRLAPPPFVRAVAYGPYESRLKDAIHALKYDRLVPASRELGRRLAKAVAQMAGEAPAEMLVIPVPLHRSKYSERGFNQAQMLATHALGSLHRTHPSWRLTLLPSALMRQRITGSQAGLTPRQRRLNLRGAFRVPDPTAVAGKHILVVDDILTTGATARAAAKVLLAAGAETVWVATLARARRRSAMYTTFASYADDADNTVLPGSVPGSTIQSASMHSSSRHLSS